MQNVNVFTMHVQQKCKGTTCRLNNFDAVKHSKEKESKKEMPFCVVSFPDVQQLVFTAFRSCLLQSIV